MRIRREQLEALRVPPQDLRRGLLQLLTAAGLRPELDIRSGDLVIPGETEGTARLSFDPQGRPGVFRGIDGRMHRLHYDAEGRIATIRDAANHDLSYHYDAVGRITAVTEQQGTRTDIQESDDRTVEFRRPSGSLRFEFTPSDLFRRIVDARGNASVFEYDERDRLTGVTDRAGASTLFGHDSNGRITSIIPPTGNRWQVEYDPAGRWKRVIHPDGAWDEYAFGDLGLVRMKRRDGGVVTMTHQGPGRPAAITYPGGSSIRLDYDDQGRLIRADNAGHPVLLEYDAEGRRVAEVVDGRRVELRYNEQGLLSGLVNHRGLSVAFEHGADQRVTTIVDWAGSRYDLERDARGDVVRVAFPGGSVLSRRRNALGLPEVDELTLRTRHLTRRYRYDANDLLTEVGDSEAGVTSHRFDVLDRLTEVRSPRRVTAYAYDGHGNALRTGQRAFEYDACDRLVDGAGYRYDDLGNVVEWQEQERTTRLFYDGQNQLVRAELPDGGTAEYEYDAFGRRVVKRLDGVTTTYTWWGELLLGEDCEDVGLRVDYLYLPGTRMPLAFRRNGTTYLYQTDHLGTPIRMFDTLGQVVWAAEVHGFEMFVHEERVAQPLRFPGHYTDAETGLHYNVGRYYHPATGRYLSPDPEFFEERTNLYVYAGDNPVAFTDPSGRLGPLAIIGIAVVAGAVLGAAFGAAHQAASNWANDRPIGEGVLGATGRGALVGAAGGLGAGIGLVAGGPWGAAALGFVFGTVASAALAAYEAPPGQGWEACKEAAIGSIPFVGSVHRYEENPDDPHRGAQLAVDLAFDVVSVGLIFLGIRNARGRAAGRTGGRGVRPPPTAMQTLQEIQNRNGQAPPGHAGGRVFQNRDGGLPPGAYREYDVHPRVPGQNRGAERIVIEQNTGKAYYTGDHYGTFTPMN